MPVLNAGLAPGQRFVLTIILARMQAGRLGCTVSRHLHVIARFADEPMAEKGLRHWIKQENNRRSHL
jgi:hypothetical protein